MQFCCQNNLYSFSCIVINSLTQVSSLEMSLHENNHHPQCGIMLAETKLTYMGYSGVTELSEKSRCHVEGTGRTRCEQNVNYLKCGNRIIIITQLLFH